MLRGELQRVQVCSLLLSGSSPRDTARRVEPRCPQLDRKIWLPPRFTLVTALSLAWRSHLSSQRPSGPLWAGCVGQQGCGGSVPDVEELVAGVCLSAATCRGARHGGVRDAAFAPLTAPSHVPRGWLVA